MSCNYLNFDPMFGGCCNPFLSPFGPMGNPYGMNDYFGGFNMFSDCQNWQQNYYLPNFDPVGLFYQTRYESIENQRAQIKAITDDQEVDDSIKQSYNVVLNQLNDYENHLKSSQNQPVQQPQQIEGKKWEDVGVTNPETQKALEQFGETPESYARKKNAQQNQQNTSQSSVNTANCPTTSTAAPAPADTTTK